LENKKNRKFKKIVFSFHNKRNVCSERQLLDFFFLKKRKDQQTTLKVFVFLLEKFKKEYAF